MTARLLMSLLTFSALFGCGPRYGRHVPDQMLLQLPYETRVELLEAENDLAVAVDHRDEAQADVMRMRDALRRGKARVEAAANEIGDASDASSREVATLALQEAEARVIYLRAQQEANVGRLALEELQLRCAFTRYELSRLALVRKAKVPGSEQLLQSEFEGQSKACDAEASEHKAALKTQAQHADAAREAWEQHRTALARKTFDARASPYVE